MAKAAKPKAVRQLNESNLNDRGYLIFGNQDSKKEYNLEKHNVRENMYVVVHHNFMKNGRGQEIPDESTERIQVYEPEDYENLIEQTNVEGNQKQNFWESQGLGTRVLHKPE